MYFTTQILHIKHNLIIDQYLSYEYTTVKLNIFVAAHLADMTAQVSVPFVSSM